MLAAVLGILKSGAAYIPLDPSFPDERLKFMAEDADLAMLVSTSDLASRFDVPRERQLLLDSDSTLIASHSGTPLAADSKLDARPEDPAYLIYTSGSTGQPKGVVVPHRAVVNFLISMAREPGLSETDVLVAVTTLSFDISVLELYLPLIVGALVVIADRNEIIDGEALRSLLEKHESTTMQATPVTWRLLLEAGWSGRDNFKALVGGEPLPKDLAQQLVANGIELWNMYGPTETTVWSTCARITDVSAGISIGTPINNTTIFILDERKNLCPVGVAGELFIGGDGVTNGYWQRPELTTDRFIDDPYGFGISGKIYATGDKARWLNGGTLEHLGRFDDQVKIRGFRIELGDIEANIVKYPDVQEAVVVPREFAPGDQRLVAFCKSSETPEHLTSQLRRHLLLTLPEYMVPAYFVPLEDLPRTQNGKLDRKSLPDFDFTESRQDARLVLPQSATEKAIARSWQDVLTLDQVGVNEDFFELGGHSLLAMQITSRIRDELSVVLPLRDFLSFPTVADQAAQVERILADSNSGVGDVSLWKSTARPDDLSGDREEIVL
jgi:amino acid adenylation domain-containing protein